MHVCVCAVIIVHRNLERCTGIDDVFHDEYVELESPSTIHISLT